MAAHPKFIRQKPLDVWTTHERLMLASSVLLSGDQNWVSVSRAIKNQSHHSRPVEYFSQKNCALQYGELLENAETPKRKRSEKNEVIPVETQGMLIVSKLRTQYMEEMVQEIIRQQEEYRKLEDEIEMVSSGHCDGQLAEIWEQIQKKQREKEESEKPPETRTETPDTAPPPASKPAAVTPPVTTAAQVSVSMDIEDNSSQESIQQEPDIEVDDHSQDVPPVVEETKPEPTPAAEPVNVLSKPSPVKIKQPEKSPIVTPTEPKKVKPVVSTSAVKEPPVVAPVTQTPKHKTRQHSGAGDSAVDANRTKVEVKSKIIPVPSLVPESKKTTPVAATSEKTSSLPSTTTEPVKESEVKSSSPVPRAASSTPPPDVVKKEARTPTTNQPMTPSQQAASAGSLRRSSRVVVKVTKEEKEKDKDVKEEGETATTTTAVKTPVTKAVSEVDLSSEEEEDEEEEEEEIEDEEELAASSKLLDSAPESPSLSIPSDMEEDRFHKAWKKSMLSVWRQIAQHKYGNVFLDKVTDEIAPGYSRCIHRPMSLTLIKQNVERNVIRTTEEFSRDVMLMFVNAIMYNNHEYDVYVMAQDMFDEAMRAIEQHKHNMALARENDSKSITLRGRKSEHSISSDKDGEKIRRRSSAEQQLDASHGSSSSGRRKTRAENN